MSPVAETSRAAFIRGMPKHGSQKHKILEFVGIVTRAGRDVTNMEISRALGLPINVVSARVHSLVHESGLLKLHCVRPCTRTHEDAQAWISAEDEIEGQRRGIMGYLLGKESR